MTVMQNIKKCHHASMAVSVAVNLVGMMLLFWWVKPKELIRPGDDMVIKRLVPPPPLKDPVIDPPPLVQSPSTQPDVPKWEPLTSMHAPAFPDPAIEPAVPLIPRTPTLGVPDLPGPIIPPVSELPPEMDKPVGTEIFTAVDQALEWLAEHQREDGSWSTDGGTGTAGRANAGATGLAVLTFLAAGESPSSVTYGRMVSRGIRFLATHQDSDGVFQPAGSHMAYGHAIALYALAEALAITGNPLLKEPVDNGVDRLLRGQQPGGGFDYDYKQTDRNDLSLGAWHLQALKAAKLAGVRPEACAEAMHRTMEAMLKGSTSKGGQRSFGYTVNGDRIAGGPRNIITAAAGVGFHFSGKSETREYRQTYKTIASFASKDRLPQWGISQTRREYGGDIMFWYYLVQALYLENPDGAEFERTLSAVVSALRTHQAEDGSWTCFTANGRKHGAVINTTMAALGMMFYRGNRLPTATGGSQNAPSKSSSGEPDVLFEI